MDTRTHPKPDWGLRLGCGLWIVIAGVAAWAVFRLLGWHISRYTAYLILGYIVYQFIEYRFDVTAQRVLEVVKEIEKTNNRLDELETSITSKLNQIDRRMSEGAEMHEPDYLTELRKQTLRD